MHPERIFQAAAGDGDATCLGRFQQHPSGTQDYTIAIRNNMQHVTTGSGQLLFLLRLRPPENLSSSLELCRFLVIQSASKALRAAVWTLVLA